LGVTPGSVSVHQKACNSGSPLERWCLRGDAAEDSPEDVERLIEVGEHERLPHAVVVTGREHRFLGGEAQTADRPQSADPEDGARILTRRTDQPRQAGRHEHRPKPLFRGETARQIGSQRERSDDLSEAHGRTLP
jgi:hypothetical protein